MYLEYGPCERLGHLALEGRLLCSIHHITQRVWKRKNSLAPSWPLQPWFQTWLCTKSESGQMGPREVALSPRHDVPPSASLAWLSGQEGADVSKSRHKTNHFNRRALWAKSHRLRVKHFHALCLFLTPILAFCRWGNRGQSKRLITWPISHN